MFRQHKILCENKETVIYLFLYDQQIDLETMKIIFAQISSQKLEARIIDYFKQCNIKYQGNHVRLVYRETIIRDLYLSHYHQSHTDATNVIHLFYFFTHLGRKSCKEHSLQLLLFLGCF